MIVVGSRVRVLRGRHFPTFQEREEGEVVSVNNDCRNCFVRFDKRPVPVLVACKHLRVIEVGTKPQNENAPPETASMGHIDAGSLATKDSNAEAQWFSQNSVRLEAENKRLAKVAGTCEALTEDLRAKFIFAQREGCELREELAWTRGEELSAELALARGEEMEAYERENTAKLEALAAQRQSEVSKLADLATSAQDHERDLLQELRIKEQDLLASRAERRELEQQMINITAELALEKEGQDRRVCSELKEQLSALREPVLLQGSNVDELLARIAELEAMNVLADARTMQYRELEDQQELACRDLQARLEKAESQLAVGASNRSELRAESAKSCSSMKEISVDRSAGFLQPAQANSYTQVFDALRANDAEPLLQALHGKPHAVESTLKARDCKTGRTLLHEVLATGNAESAAALLTAGQTLMQRKMYLHNLQGEQLEREARLLVNTRDAVAGKTPLASLCAQREPSKELVVQLLNAKADLQIPDKDGVTPFMECVKAGHLELAELFMDLTRGTVCLDVDATGRTPLHWAASGGHREMVEFLVGVKAELTAIDNDGRTAAGAAQDQSHVALAILLQKAELGQGELVEGHEDDVGDEKKRVVPETGEELYEEVEFEVELEVNGSNEQNGGSCPEFMEADPEMFAAMNFPEGFGTMPGSMPFVVMGDPEEMGGMPGMGMPHMQFMGMPPEFLSGMADGFRDADMADLMEGSPERCRVEEVEEDD